MDELDYLGGDICIHVVGYWEAKVAVAVHLHSYVNGLEETVFVNAGEDEVAFVEGFGALCGGADAHSGDGFAYAEEETTLFGECAGVADNGKGVQLEVVVVMETERFVGDNALVKFEA